MLHILYGMGSRDIDPGPTPGKLMNNRHTLLPLTNNSSTGILASQHAQDAPARAPKGNSQMQTNIIHIKQTNLQKFKMLRTYIRSNPVAKESRQKSFISIIEACKESRQERLFAGVKRKYNRKLRGHASGRTINGKSYH